MNTMRLKKMSLPSSECKNARRALLAASLLGILSLTGCADIPYFGTASKLNLPPAGMNLAKAAAPAAIAPVGPPLHCIIEKGSALFGRSWRDFSTTRFDTLPGERSVISITEQRNSDNVMTVQVRFDENGQKLVFCPIREDVAPDAKITCASLYALEDDFTLGIKRTLDVPAALRSGVLRCGFNNLPK